MTFDEFKTDLIQFLDDSTVNLGRKGTKTRVDFFKTIVDKFNIFDCSGEITPEAQKSKGNTNPDLISIKPQNKRRSLDIGKGVHAMTASESMRADEQLNRSPYSSKKKGD